jgi:Ribonuclease G/E
LFPICVSIVYTTGMEKDSALRIRVQRDLREKFLEVCRADDKPAAQVIREFMRDYIREHVRRFDPRARPRTEPIRRDRKVAP